MATNEETKQIEDLLEKARKTIAEGMAPKIEADMAYAVKQTQSGAFYVSDSKRWWADPQLVRSIDDYGNGIVTIYDYLKHLPLFKAEDITAAGMVPVKAEELAGIFKISQTVVFTHNEKDEKGHQKRRAIEC